MCGCHADVSVAAVAAARRRCRCNLLTLPDQVVVEALGTRAHVEKAERMLRCQHADVTS